MPRLISFSTGNSIEIVYDAGGQKLRKIVKTGATIQYEHDYAGGLEYRKTGTGSKRVEAVYHAEGRYYNLNVDANNTVAWRREYALRDHLGNTRLMFADKNGNGIIEVTNNPATCEIIQENHYYPFGLNHEGPWLMNDAARDNLYQYNGKEWNADFGLGLYDFGNRWHDPALGRFTTVDRFADKYTFQSPYVMAANDPMKFVDVNGDSVWISYNGADILYENGNLFNQDGSQYTGKGVGIRRDGTLMYKGFLRQAKGALDLLSTTSTGQEIINQLQTSTNDFVIARKSGASNFVSGFGTFGNNEFLNNAQAFRIFEEGKKVLESAVFNQIGTGGTIWIDLSGTKKYNAIKLGHELAHATDADRGMLDPRNVPINGGLEQRQEIRAVYSENLIRRELGVKYRKRYSDGGPKLISPTGTPFHYPPPQFPLIRL